MVHRVIFKKGKTEGIRRQYHGLSHFDESFHFTYPGPHAPQFLSAFAGQFIQVVQRRHNPRWFTIFWKAHLGFRRKIENFEDLRFHISLCFPQGVQIFFQELPPNAHLDDILIACTAGLIPDGGHLFQMSVKAEGLLGDLCGFMNKKQIPVSLSCFRDRLPFGDLQGFHDRFDLLAHNLPFQGQYSGKGKFHLHGFFSPRRPHSGHERLCKCRILSQDVIERQDLAIRIDGGTCPVFTGLDPRVSKKGQGLQCRRRESRIQGLYGNRRIGGGGLEDIIKTGRGIIKRLFSPRGIQGLVPAHLCLIDSLSFQCKFPIL